MGCTNNSKIKNLNLDEFDNFKSNNNTYILVIGKEGCPYCDKAKTIIKENINDINKEVVYLEMNKDNRDSYLNYINNEFSCIDIVPYTFYIETVKL